MSTDYSCEKKLADINQELHRRYCDSLFAVTEVLAKYKAMFPDYTDHSILHTMNIIEFCNILIGSNISEMNDGEIYVLLMAAALHDTGMGISEKDYAEFIVNPMFEKYLQENGDNPKAIIVRDLHHELSGLFIRKYSGLFEIPCGFVFPVVQAARGHRKTDLYDGAEYSAKYNAAGYNICLPYITALIRLADELDITAERNIYLSRDISSISNEYSLMVWKLHHAIKSVELNETKCIITAKMSEINDTTELLSWINKLKNVISYTSDVVEKTSKYKLLNRAVILKGL